MQYTPLLALLALASAPLSAQEILVDPAGRIQAISSGRGLSIPGRTPDERAPVALPVDLAPWSAARIGSETLIVGTRVVQGAQELAIWSTTGREIPAPGSRRGLLRHSPLLLGSESGLDGLVWFEGDEIRTGSVRSAWWDGSAWRVEEVEGPGPGSQLAGTAARLDDGLWLLCWSRFDGQDDEIACARGSRRGWSAPERPHPGNDVPDVTPTVVATADGGAILVWSRYDGHDYRLVSSRWSPGGAWSEPEVLGGPGSVTPRFTSLGPTSVLVYREGLEDRWAAWRFSGPRPTARTSIAGPTAERPVPVMSDDVRLVVLRPDGSEREAEWAAVP